MTERKLIEAAQAGEREAFSRLLEQEYAVIFRIAMQWCGVRADAEDITQQACIKLARSIGQFRFQSAFHTWLYRLVINCAKDWQKSQARHEYRRVSGDDAAAVLDKQPGPTVDPETTRYLEYLMQWIAGLGEGFRETTLLVLGEGFSHREAADILGVGEGTISWRIHEIRKHLRNRETHGGGES